PTKRLAERREQPVEHWHHKNRGQCEGTPGRNFEDADAPPTACAVLQKAQCLNRTEVMKGGENCAKALKTFRDRGRIDGIGDKTHAFRGARPAVTAVASSRKLICKQNFDRRCTFALVEPHQRRPRPTHARKKVEHATCSSVIERGAQSPGDWPICVRALEDHLQRVNDLAPQKIRKPRLVVNLEQLKSHLPSRTPLPQPENSRRASPRKVVVSLCAGDHRLRCSLRLVLWLHERVAREFDHLLQMPPLARIHRPAFMIGKIDRCVAFLGERHAYYQRALLLGILIVGHDCPPRLNYRKHCACFPRHSLSTALF